MLALENLSRNTNKAMNDYLAELYEELSRETIEESKDENKK